MPLMKKEVPLLKCEIIHSIPGRIRLRCRAIKYFSKCIDDLTNDLKNISFIKDAKISLVTSNVLIHYDNTSMMNDDIIEVIESVISTYSLIAYKAERSEMNHVTVSERRLQEESFGTILRRAALTSITLLAHTFIPHKDITGGSLFSKLTTIPSIASIVLSKSVFKSGMGSMIKDKRPNADTLTMTAIITSLLTGRDASALITILLSDVAESLTAYTMDRTRNVIRNMLDMGEEFVWRKNSDGSLTKVNISQININDSISIQTGDKISVDGIILDGEAVIDQASITGEFMPVTRKSGDNVFAGTIVKSGNIVVQAKKVGDETAVSRIVNMVEDASNNKADIQIYADRFSAELLPLNFALAGIVYLTTKSVTRALNMLIIDYSCGARLSTATALSAAIHTAAKNGVLLKGGNLIENIAKADTLILDKTGTMTEGKPKVLSIVPANNDVSPKTIIEIASAAEETSNHPLAVAIINKANMSGYTIPEHDETIIHVARGVETKVNNKIVRVGNKKFMLENKISTTKIDDKIKALMNRGENVIFVSHGEKLLGVVGVRDALRENMKKSINRLRYLGFDDVKLLTGDIENQAEMVAKSMAVDGFASELMPEDKAKTVLELQSKGSKVVMIGDGVNDAPALAYADVGIAIGNTRTDIAIEASDVTITSDDPLLIPATVNLSKKTMSIIKQNFAATLGVNTLALVLGATGVLPVIWGAVIHNMTTIIVVGNSGRLLFNNLDNFERR